MSIILIVLFLFLALVSLGFFFASKQKKTGNTNGRYEKYIAQFDPLKNRKELAPIYTKVAGVRFKNPDTGVAYQTIIAKCKQGEQLILMPDPLNRYDKDAVKVLTINDEMIGYLDVKHRLEEGFLVKAKIHKLYKNDDGIKEVEMELVRYSKKQS